MPQPTVRLLQDKGSVQLLGAAHRWRKQMFMSLMTPAGIGRLADLCEEEWRAAVRRWTGMDRVVLLMRRTRCCAALSAPGPAWR